MRLERSCSVAATQGQYRRIAAIVWVEHSYRGADTQQYGYATLMVWLAKKLERTSNVAGTQL